MKRLLILATITLGCSLTNAQTLFDGLKATESDISGTARYSSMAGAFGALGGDASAIKDNPAGLGIYRRSEVTGTLNALIQNSRSTWNGQSSSDNIFKLGLNNFSLIFAVPTWRSENGKQTGLLSSNFSFSYNKLKDYNRNLQINGGSSLASMTDYMAYFSQGLTSSDLDYVNGSYEPFDNESIPWLSILGYEGYLINETAENSKEWRPLLSDNEYVKPSYSLSETGSISEYSFGWSGNISNQLYLGATLNLRTINYNIQSFYSEEFSNGRNMELRNSLSTTGSGVNLNIGAIYSPISFLRLGAAIHTPMVFFINTQNQALLTYNTVGANSILTPYNPKDYRLLTPFEYNLSVAYIVGRKGLISAEYDYKNYKGSKLEDSNGFSQTYENANEDIDHMLNNTSTFKIGGEYRATDNISIRAGYAMMSRITNNNTVKWMDVNTRRTDTEYFTNKKNNYITAGLGYREAGWYIDMAFVHKILNENYYAYNSTAMNQNYAVSPAKVFTYNNDVVVTLGFRF